MATTPTDADRRPRADARRNRELLVAAAARVFAVEGINAPLDAVARDAGVGNATMYRNFPTREAMLETVLHTRYQSLATRAKDLAEVTPADTALITWLREFIDYIQTFRGLPEPVMATLRNRDSALYASCKAMRDAAARLLARAQRAGTLRDDINATDVFTHAAGIAWAAQQASPDPRRVERLLTVMVDGLRPRNPSPDECGG
jgi:AcrR family transcriptional regulator